MPLLARYFTKRIYEHLYLHCCHIAHYDGQGFFNTYFFNPEDTIKFIKQFDKDYGLISVEYQMNWISGDCEDIGKVMCEIVDKHKHKLYAKLKRDIKTDKLKQIERLKEEIKEVEI